MFVKISSIIIRYFGHYEIAVVYCHTYYCNTIIYIGENTMKNTKKLLALLLALAMVFSLAACGSKDSGEETTEQTGTETGTETGSTFDYSYIYDENGYFKDVKALDYVTLADYSKISVSSEDVESQVEYFLAQYPDHKEVTDRAVEDGNTVNIDYVGSIDGVEFDGGSTGGNGTEVTIGVTSYIDDFLEQLIGHMPGETFDVNVTFPEDYGVEDLNGKDAVFVTTINHIVEETDAVLDDAFVANNLSAEYKWTTVAEMRTGIAEAIAAQNIFEASEVSDELPEAVIEYELDNMVEYYRQYAQMYGVELDEFLTTYVGVESEEALREQSRDYCIEQCQYYMFLQAVAEAEGITPTEEDARRFMSAQNGDDSLYENYVDNFGLNYVMSLALYSKVDEFLGSKAVVE